MRNISLDFLHNTIVTNLSICFQAFHNYKKVPTIEFKNLKALFFEPVILHGLLDALLSAFNTVLVLVLLRGMFTPLPEVSVLIKTTYILI